MDKTKIIQRLYDNNHISFDEMLTLLGYPFISSDWTFTDMCKTHGYDFNVSSSKNPSNDITY